MATERTLSILKPDATERNLTGKINAVFEENGLKIVAQKRLQLSEAQAAAFYAVHKERSFFGELVSFMISGPVVVQVLEGDNAMQKNRDLMGATNPANAADGTIRKMFAEGIERNSVHGSDSAENAATESPSSSAASRSSLNATYDSPFLEGVGREETRLCGLRLFFHFAPRWALAHRMSLSACAQLKAEYLHLLRIGSADPHMSLTPSASSGLARASCPRITETCTGLATLRT